MSAEVLFTEQEYETRLTALRARMSERGLDVCLVSTPENIFYLTGLDHWGYFAPHVLIVPAGGRMVLVTRAMEKVTVSNQVRNAWFEGHEDSETAADVTVRSLGDLGATAPRARSAAQAIIEAVCADDLPRRARFGIEKWSSGLPHGLAARIFELLPDVDWDDISGLVDDLRVLKSPAEQQCMREAARVSEASMLAAIASIAAGATERGVAAECHRAMIEAGGSFPGFGPFIRPTSRLGEEHTSWGVGTFSHGDAVFLELSGCVMRYHAPMGRLVHIGEVAPGAREMARVSLDAFEAVVEALRPGARAREVYAAWQGVVDRAGMPSYRRHHCGYLVGIGFPPSWTGGNRVTGLHPESDVPIRAGMSLHILSWLMGTGRGDWFVSNTVLVHEHDVEVLNALPRDVIVR